MLEEALEAVMKLGPGLKSNGPTTTVQYYDGLLVR
jgi:hypothetical protein